MFPLWLSLVSSFSFPSFVLVLVLSFWPLCILVHVSLCCSLCVCLLFSCTLTLFPLLVSLLCFWLLLLGSFVSSFPTLFPFSFLFLASSSTFDPSPFLPFSPCFLSLILFCPLASSGQLSCAWPSCRCCQVKQRFTQCVCVRARVVVVVVPVNGAFTAVLHNPGNLTVSCNLTHTRTHTHRLRPVVNRYRCLFCKHRTRLVAMATAAPTCPQTFFFSGLEQVTSTFTCTCDRGGGLERSLPPPPLCLVSSPCILP